MESLYKMAIKKKEIFEVSVHDFDALVTAHYGKIYSFQQQDGCKERQVVKFILPIEEPENYDVDEEKEVATLSNIEINGNEMGVKFDTWKSRVGKFFLDNDFHEKLWWERNFYPNVEMILNDLHSKGILENGELRIDIDW